MYNLHTKTKVLWRVLVRVLVVLLKERSLFLFKEQQAPEQAPAIKPLFLFVNIILFGTWAGCLLALAGRWLSLHLHKLTL